MITIKTQEEFNKRVTNGVFKVDDDLTLEFDLVTDADINAGNIDARNIKAKSINAWYIDAEDIDAGNIDAWYIDAEDIDAGNIDAWYIDAWNIKYYAVCCAYIGIKCDSIKGRRENAKHFALDGEIVTREKGIEL